jgi:hypothetical protein
MKLATRQKFTPPGVALIRVLRKEKYSSIIEKGRKFFEENEHTSAQNTIAALGESAIILMAKYGPLDVQFRLVRGSMLRITGLRDEEGRNLQDIFAASDNDVIKARFDKVMGKSWRHAEITARKVNRPSDPVRVTNRDYTG